MDTSQLVGFAQEFILVLVVGGFFLFYSIFRGRQAVINVTVGLYLALLVSLVFPYYDSLIPATSSAHSAAVGKIVLFMIFALLTTILVTRLMPSEYRENKFESLGKKLLLTIGATCLVLVFSYQVVPVGELVDSSTPLQTLFAPQQYFFWWLLAPLAILYIN